jgi:hypothetical protein
MQHAKIHRRLGPADGKKVVAKTGQILAKCGHWTKTYPPAAIRVIA